jgi:hypothetical protein
MTKCKRYEKTTKGNDPTKPKEIGCLEIISIDKNFPSEFGKQYRTRFCCGNPDDCVYNGLANFVESMQTALKLPMAYIKKH